MRFNKKLTKDLNNINLKKCRSITPEFLWRLPIFNFISPIVTSFKLSKKIDKNEDFIILARDPVSILAALLSKLRNNNIKIIGYFHSAFNSSHWKLIMFVLSLFTKYIDIIVTNSKFTQKIIKKKLNCDSIIIYPGVDFKIKIKKIRNNLLDKSIKEDNKIILSIGVYKRKGIEYGLIAFSKLLKKYPSIKYVIIGKTDKSYFNKMIKLTKQLNIQENVIFLGELDEEEVNYCYNLADFVLVPSIVEPFGIVLIEAAIFKKPIIASNLCSIRETLIDKKTGILVNPKDSDSIFNALEYLLKNKKISKKIGIEAYNYVKNKYSWKKSANATFKIIKSLDY